MLFGGSWFSNAVDQLAWLDQMRGGGWRGADAPQSLFGEHRSGCFPAGLLAKSLAKFDGVRRNDEGFVTDLR